MDKLPVASVAARDSGSRVSLATTEPVPVLCAQPPAAARLRKSFLQRCRHRCQHEAVVTVLSKQTEHLPLRLRFLLTDQLSEELQDLPSQKASVVL